MKRTGLIVVLQLLVFISFSQFSITGEITNEQNGALTGANIQLIDGTSGAVSDGKGLFEIRDLSSGTYIMAVSYIGFTTITRKIILTKDFHVRITLLNAGIKTDEIIVQSTRAGKLTPTTYSYVKKDEIESNNFGQDLPYLLSMQPGLVSSSDAGAGIGYTGMWIRGSNIQRINVTVNGIPVNDPESHGVFWVNMPDFASSVNSIQVQRGVGTSTNGGGAFGATVNLETSSVNKKASAEISNAFGSFNTSKTNIKFGTGLINKHWFFDGRLSKIKSDGYIDRSASDLQSYYVQAGYQSEKTLIKAIVFSGKEKTGQAWWGVDDWTVNAYGRKFNWAGVIYNEDGTMRFYDQQTDNYQQDHYQLHLSHLLGEHLSFGGAIHYTYGRGYYEEYNQGDLLANYPIGNQIIGSDTITNSDLIVRRWLDNHFYGGTYAFNYHKNKLRITFGGAANKYANARHLGEIIWAQFSGLSNIRDKYYDNTSNKSDINNYLKVNYQLGSYLNLFADLQVRNVDYVASGTDKGGDDISINKQFTFFNPKAGLSYKLNRAGQLYASIAIAHREPIRTDFIDAPTGTDPVEERLIDYEFGLRNNNQRFAYNINAYYMLYSNQLVLTGEINDVGSPIRANVGESYRIGTELEGSYKFSEKVQARTTLSVGSSGTEHFEEQANGTIKDFGTIQLSFSPQTIAGIELLTRPITGIKLALRTKYVSKQYLDLTQNEELTLDPYSSTDFRVSYKLRPAFMREIDLSVLLNNIFDQMYASNGYVWGGTRYYYPQAGLNVLGSITLKF